jgi:hypothetical protein
MENKGLDIKSKEIQTEESMDYRYLYRRAKVLWLKEFCGIKLRIKKKEKSLTRQSYRKLRAD